MKTTRNRVMLGSVLGCVCWGVVACDVQPIGAGRGHQSHGNDDSVPGTLPTVSGMMLAPYTPPAMDVVNLGFSLVSTIETATQRGENNE